jgi:hypothetical protein
VKYERRYEQNSPEHHEAYQIQEAYKAVGSGYVDADIEIEWKKARTYHAAGDLNGANIHALAAIASQNAYAAGRKNVLDPNFALLCTAAQKAIVEAAKYDATVNRTGPPAFVK